MVGFVGLRIEKKTTPGRDDDTVQESLSYVQFQNCTSLFCLSFLRIKNAVLYGSVTLVASHTAPTS